MQSPKAQAPNIFTRKRMAAKFARSRARQSRSDAANFLSEAIAEDFAERMDFMQLSPGKALVVGDSENGLEARLKAMGAEVTAALLGDFDEEVPGKDSGFDVFLHSMGLGMVNDLPGALIHARHSLAENGLFFAAFLGAGSLPVLRQLALIADGERPAARMHPLVDNRAGTALLERAGFKRQVVDSYPLNVRYSSLSQLVEDLRDHGLTASLTSAAPPLTRKGWGMAVAAFDDLRDADGKVTERFEILTLTGWR